MEGPSTTTLMGFNPFGVGPNSIKMDVQCLAYFNGPNCLIALHIVRWRAREAPHGNENFERGIYIGVGRELLKIQVIRLINSTRRILRMYAPSFFTFVGVSWTEPCVSFRVHFCNTNSIPIPVDFSNPWRLSFYTNLWNFQSKDSFNLFDGIEPHFSCLVTHKNKSSFWRLDG